LFNYRLCAFNELSLAPLLLTRSVVPIRKLILYVFFASQHYDVFSYVEIPCLHARHNHSTPQETAYVVKLGMSEDGAVTSEWIEAIRQRHADEALAAILASKKRISEEEALWAGLVK
jgi:hypothetical protein